MCLALLYCFSSSFSFFFFDLHDSDLWSKMPHIAPLFTLVFFFLCVYAASSRDLRLLPHILCPLKTPTTKTEKKVQNSGVSFRPADQESLKTTFFLDFFFF